jgi:hypothetical protein
MIICNYSFVVKNIKTWYIYGKFVYGKEYLNVAGRSF